MVPAQPWSYKAGQPARGDRPSSLVRVYERIDRPGRIYLSCAWRKTDAGRSREEPLPPGTTQAEARDYAEETAAERTLSIMRGEAELPTARQGPVSLGRLLATYHSSRKAQDWSQTHIRDQERWRRYWLAAFGRDRPVGSITPAEVEQVAGESTEANGWSAATEAKALKYLKAATRHAARKALILRDDPLVAVDVPRVHAAVDAPIYEDYEVARLCEPHPEVDWRVTLACSIAADTGRRIGAIRQLRREDVRFREGECWLLFRVDTDKTGRAGVVPVSDRTVERILEALNRPEVQVRGWLLPGGAVGSLRRADVPWGGFDSTGSGGPIGKLHKAEETLGIEGVPGRAYHAVKRAHVSASWELAGGDAAKVGDLTGNTSPDVLRRHYRKATASSKVAHMRLVSARFSDHSKEGATLQATPNEFAGN